MRIQLGAHGFNGPTQRLHAELRADGHEVSFEYDIAASVTEEASALWRPDVPIAPFMKRRIPESVWSRRPCLVVHPGPPGDRGPAALDWAVLDGARLAAKRDRRARDEAARPLAAYRADELARMQRNFYGFDPSCHVARHHFVTRKPQAWSPRHLALHRR